jgi:hypothetical protein
MCYKAPGPRCSAHAKKKLISAITHLKSLSLFNDPPEVYDDAKQAVADAKMDYDSTPAGQKYLQLRIDQGMDRSGEYKERLANAKKLRRIQLKAISEKEAGDINNHPEVSKNWESEDLEDNGVPRTGWGLHPHGVEKKIEQYEDISFAAAQTLNADEQNALYWVTSDGGPFINSKLIAKKEASELLPGWNWENRPPAHERSGYTKEFTQKKIRHLNSAFKKFSLENNAVLYRGLNNWNLPDELHQFDVDQNTINNYLEQKYPVGSTIEVPEYMSTSSDPTVAQRFTGNNSIVLEVSTKNAIPVGYMSAWGNHEREFIVNKNQKYKVKAILSDVDYQYANRRGDAKSQKTTVIQLEAVEG